MRKPRVTKVFTLQAGVLALMIFTSAQSARTEQLLFSNRNGFGSIQSIDTSTGIITTITATPRLPNGSFDLPEGLVVAPNGDIVYSMDFNSPSEIAVWNGTSNQTVAAGLALGDITLAPDGKSVYVGDVSGVIYQVDLATLGVSTFASGLGQVGGLAFGSDGNLYAVTHLGNEVDEFNASGGVIHSVSGFGSDALQGMTFDPTTHAIWAVTGLDVLWEFPLGLGSEHLFFHNNLIAMDGIVADGLGHFYISESFSGIVEYDIAANTANFIDGAAGIADLALAQPSAPPPPPPPQVPEPASIALLGTAAVLIAISSRYRFAKRSA
jgi:outer membrane protein assembly factor BamB